MHLSDIMEVLDYKVTDGSEYMWACFGPSRYMEFESDYSHVSVVFSIETQEVLEITTCPKTAVWEIEPPPYRYIHSSCIEEYRLEAKRRNVDPNQAWDDVKFVDIDTEEDILDKAKSIFEGKQDYDRRIVIPIEGLPQDVFLAIAHMAHDRDITINEMFEEILRKAIDDLKQNGLNI